MRRLSPPPTISRWQWGRGPKIPSEGSRRSEKSPPRGSLGTRVTDFDFRVRLENPHPMAKRPRPSSFAAPRRATLSERSGYLPSIRNPRVRSEWLHHAHPDRLFVHAAPVGGIASEESRLWCPFRRRLALTSQALADGSTRRSGFWSVTTGCRLVAAP